MDLNDKDIGTIQNITKVMNEYYYDNEMTQDISSALNGMANVLQAGVSKKANEKLQDIFEGIPIDSRLRKRATHDKAINARLQPNSVFFWGDDINDNYRKGLSDNIRCFFFRRYGENFPNDLADKINYSEVYNNADTILSYISDWEPDIQFQGQKLSTYLAWGTVKELVQNVPFELRGRRNIRFHHVVDPRDNDEHVYISDGFEYLSGAQQLLKYLAERHDIDNNGLLNDLDNEHSIHFQTRKPKKESLKGVRVYYDSSFEIRFTTIALTERVLDILNDIKNYKN